MKKHLLFPGRHHLTTTFQQQYLNKVTSKDLKDVFDVFGDTLRHEGKLDDIVFAMTSANHSATRRNPLPMHRREGLLEDFSQNFSLPSYVYPIDDIGKSQKFAEYLIKKIAVESNRIHELSPETTVVLSSTPEIIEQFLSLGYQVIPAELEHYSPLPELSSHYKSIRPWVRSTGSQMNTEKSSNHHIRPWELVEYLVQLHGAGKDRETDDMVLDHMTKSTKNLYKKYNVVPYLHTLFTDGLLGNDGDITETRDYNTYVRAFDEGAERKYDLVKDYILPGKIVDIGCCTGSLIAELTKDPNFSESDFYGVEVARKLYQECLKRKEEGYFHNDNVFFLAKNVAKESCFSPHTIDTFTTFSLTHEIFSYQGEQALDDFLGLISEQTKSGGRWINVDVIGPEEGDRVIFTKLSKNDGGGEKKSDQELATMTREEFSSYLKSLSTYERFLRFVKDFRKEEGDGISYHEEVREGENYIVCRYRDMCEFLSKKDYTDNWKSEMHEKFCDKSFSDWEGLLGEKGFTLHKDSKAFTNPWIVEHRLKGKVQMFEQGEDEKMLDIGYPPTNVILIAEKGK